MKKHIDTALLFCLCSLVICFSLPALATGAGETAVAAAATEQTAAGVTEERAAAGETAAGVTEERAAAEESAAGVTEERAAAEESAAGVTEERAAAEEAAAGVTEERAATEETAAGVTEERAAAEEAAAGVTEERAVTEETAAGVTEERAATEETSGSMPEEQAGTTERQKATERPAAAQQHPVPATERNTARAAGQTAAAVTEAGTAAAPQAAKEQKAKIKAGWFKKGKNYYYRKSDGTILRTSGIVKLGKYRYCLGKNGKRLSGLQKVKGKWYYFRPKNGRREEKAGWKKIKGRKYYIQKKGVVATGVKKIGRIQYGFLSTGELRGVSDPFRYNGKWYRTDRYGVAEKLSTIQISCSRETRKYIERHTTPDMSSSAKLNCLYHILLSSNYVSGCIDRSETEAEDFQYRLAYKVLVSRKYNCYGFACTFASIAKELGYEPYVVVLDVDHAVVTIDGKYYDNMGARFGADSPALKDVEIYKKVKF